MNSLGIGNSGNSFNLVPANQIKRYTKNNKFNHINKNFINSISKIKGKSKEGIIQQKRNKIHESFCSDIKNIIPQKHKPAKEIIEKEKNQPEITQNNSNKIIGFSDKNLNLDVNWTDVFLTVCKKRLFNTFKDLKILISRHPLFQNKFICYIDQINTKYLIENQKKKIMTLRILLSNLINKQITETTAINLEYSVNLNKALDLVKNLEYLGPANNLLIALDEVQVKMLQNHFIKGNHLYWPNGNDGITWCTNLG